MRYELGLIKKKAILVMDSVEDQETETHLINIVKLVDGCMTAIDKINKNTTYLALDIRRITADTK